MHVCQSIVTYYHDMTIFVLVHNSQLLLLMFSDVEILLLYVKPELLIAMRYPSVDGKAGDSRCSRDIDLDVLTSRR